MAAPTVVSVFIPRQIINNFSLNLYGHYKILGSSVFINCIVSTPLSENLIDEFKICENSSDNKEDNFCLLGVLYSSKNKKNSINDTLKHHENFTSFIIRTWDLNTFYVENIFVKSVGSNLPCQIIIYDSSSLLKASVLKTISSRSVSKKNFVSFLLDSCESAEKYHDLSYQGKSTVYNKYFHKSSLYKCASKLWYSLYSFLAICLRFLKILSPTPWFQNILFQIGTCSRVGQQLHQKFIHCHKIVSSLKTKNELSLRCRNLVCAIILDFLLGWLLVIFLFHSDVPLELLNFAIENTNSIVSSLKHLIHWLMGAPAGLKLNIPLNKALGHFFLYHIYLWEAYMTVVLPVFTFIFMLSKYIGILGITLVLCLFCDVISIATVHIYCFYGYATRLYGYLLCGLSALWRLFRGKKWNPLRQRVDSYSYDVHQLFLGTLLFTVLLFLFPTVMVYYTVFTCLRIIVLITQGIVSKVIDAFTISPLYSVVAWILGSSETAGDVFLSVINTQGSLVFSLQTCQVPLSVVVKETLPTLFSYREIVSWGDFSHSLITGKIIYPL